MSFDKVLELIERAPVVAGMERMQPAMRALATALVARFTDRRDAPLPIAEEGAALALWGAKDGAAVFLAWHRAQGGLARALDVTLAAIGYERVRYEWDSSAWALRRARPAAGLTSLGIAAWLWLRAALAAATPAERAAAREVAGRASKAWLVRAALAVVFPEDDALWTAADDAELRQADADDHATTTFGVLVAMRRAALDPRRLSRPWRVADALPAEAIVAALGTRAVAPLRLIRAFDALAALPAPDAIRALAEFADEAWATLAAIEPSRASIAALAPLFTTQRPRRVLGLRLARALFDEHVVAVPAVAAELARGPSADAALIAAAIADTGAALPHDDGWVSPWVAAPRPARGRGVARPAAASPPVELPFAEAIHWAPGEQAQRHGNGGHRGTRDHKEASLVDEARSHTVFLSSLTWMSDEPARRTWRAIEPKRWYGQIDEVEQLLARFGLDELDAVIAFVQARPDRLAALARVESPRVAPMMARGFALLKKQHEIARAWLDRFPEAAAIGLLGAAATAAKPQRDAAGKALAHLSKHHAAVVADVLARAARAGGTEPGAPEPLATSSRIRALADADVPSLPARPPKLPAFIDVTRLPRPIRTDGRAALAGGALVELVQVLKATLPGGHPALETVTARYTPESLARLAFGLFRQWLFAKGPPKDKWALHAVGKFPDDETARALGRLARVWAPRGNSARAQEAIETLAMMRSQAGLIEIHDTARKVRSKALQARAEKVFETVAESLGLAPEELADRLVPELAEHELVFGDLRVEFDASLAPRLVAPDGSASATLPGKPEPDDANRWRELKRMCGAVARGQRARLEQAMADGHRMPFGHFAEVYLMHSLIRNLSSSLLWGCYAADQLAFGFTVADGGGFDVRGNPIELPLDARYGVVHPAELAPPDRAAWAARFPSQPFEQLDRAVFTVADTGELQRKLASLVSRVVPTAGLLALQRRGWRRGDSPQGGRYYWIERAGRGWSVEVMFMPGIYLGDPNDEPTQALASVVVHADAPLPPAIASELQRDLTWLAPR